jgi:hypothetical protein
VGIHHAGKQQAGYGGWIQTYLNQDEWLKHRDQIFFCCT